LPKTTKIVQIWPVFYEKMGKMAKILAKIMIFLNSEAI